MERKHKVLGIIKHLKKNPLYGNLLVSLAALVFVFFIAEICFRWNGKYAVYSEKFGGGYSSIFVPHERNWYHVYKPGELRRDYSHEFSYSCKANNEGLLEMEFVLAKDKNAVRIMVLGDSFIQGIGAPYDSSCPRQLQRLLNQQLIGKKIEVWDCGVGGSDPFFEYVLFQKLIKYDPDYVVVAMNATDVNDVYLRGGMERFRPDSSVVYRQRPWFEPLYGKSFVVRRVVHDLLRYNWLLQKPSEQELARVEAIRNIESVLDSFQNICTKSHIPLLISFQPCLWEFNKGTTYSMKELKQYCDSAKISAVDLKPYLDQLGYKQDNVKDIYWPIDGHFNSKGYGLYADFLSSQMCVDILNYPNAKQLKGNQFLTH